MASPASPDPWGGLADDLPAAPRSVLQPYVEAVARDDPLPKVRPRPDKQALKLKVRPPAHAWSLRMQEWDLRSS